MLCFFFSRQPISQEVRAVSSPVSPSHCKRTDQLPVLGKPAAAGDRCGRQMWETVVYEPLGGYGELRRGRLSRQAKHRPMQPQDPGSFSVPGTAGTARWGGLERPGHCHFLVALRTHRMTGLSQAHSWVDSVSQTSEPVHPGACVGEPGVQRAQPEVGRGLSGNQLFSLGPSTKKRKGLKVRETHSQAMCLSSRLDIFFLF